MSGPLRSKQGCWTCRLRKKKCDEGRPACAACESRSIMCYGYGPRPEWMDNGEKERAVANSLKKIVNHTSRRKATSIQLTKQRKTVIKIAPKSLENSSPSLGSSSQDGVTPPVDRAAVADHRNDTPKDGSHDSLSSDNSDHLMIRPAVSISADDSVLLMHFLDNIFPLQLPMYRPGVLEGGRGWLLSLLLRTKPLYHAALALSAYHRRTIMLSEPGQLYRATDLAQQEKHLEICINLLNKFVQNSCPVSGLGIMTSVVQLVFFELFTGYGSGWQAHLHAAISMYDRGFKENLTHFGLSEESKTAVYEDIPLSGQENVVMEQVVNFRFLGGTVIWLDIISSITAGTTPYLLSYHSCVINSSSQTRLADIMGCQNWVMLQIGSIAALHDHKTRALQEGHFDSTEFKQAASDIDKEIQCGLAHRALEGFRISEHDPTTSSNVIPDPTTLVTHLFVFMASIYLHLATYGFQELEVLDTTISRAIIMLQTQVPIHLLPALVLPLYIIGSVARTEEEQYFRSIFSSTLMLNPLFRHRERILPILEEIWSRRQSARCFTWEESLELVDGILLL